jgi:hypothetical protein
LGRLVGRPVQVCCATHAAHSAGFKSTHTVSVSGSFMYWEPCHRRQFTVHVERNREDALPGADDQQKARDSERAQERERISLQGGLGGITCVCKVGVGSCGSFLLAFPYMGEGSALRCLRKGQTWLACGGCIREGGGLAGKSYWEREVAHGKEGAA